MRLPLFRATLSFLAVCAAAIILIAPIHAAPATTPGFEFVGEAGWVSLDSGTDTINASFDLAWSVGKHFAFGPTIGFMQIKPNPMLTDGETPVTDPPASVSSLHDSGHTFSTYTIGVRSVFHFSPAHNGFFVALDATLPQADAEGYVLTPEIGVQFIKDHFLMRATYAHPLHYSEGDAVDLGRKEVAVGFGGAW